MSVKRQAMAVFVHISVKYFDICCRQTLSFFLSSSFPNED